MKNKSLFSRLLENKKLMLIVSLVLSFLFWMISSDNTTQTIDDITIKYSLSESASESLKVFNVSSETVSVMVSGKRVIIDSLSEEDVIARVDLFGVSEPGTATYDVIVESTGNLSFDVDSVRPKTVTVMVDREATKTVNVIGDFTYNPDGYYVENNLPETVTITGPESKVKNVKSAYVSGNVKSPDAEDITNTYTLRLFDHEDPTSADAKEINTDYITMSYESTDVLFRFMKIDEDMPISLKCEPSNFNLPSTYYTITPSTLSVAGREELLFGDKAVGSLNIDLGNLSKYKNQIYNESYDVQDLLGSDFVNKSDGIETIKVQLDFSGLSMDTFDVPSSNISIKNLPEGYTYTAPSTYAVSVVGTRSALSVLTSDSFTIEYDFKDVTPSADTPVNVPVSIQINKSIFCWVYRLSDTASVIMNTAE